MFGFGSSVRLIDLGPRDGIVQGECSGFHWEARLARGPVSYGIDPATCYKGSGRVARLVVYEGRQGGAGRRKVAAFDRGWLFGRKDHLAVIQRVVRYLEVR